MVIPPSNGVFGSLASPSAARELPAVDAYHSAGRRLLAEDLLQCVFALAGKHRRSSANIPPSVSLLI